MIISKRRETLILSATILATGMAFLDSTIVNIALPSIQNSFNATFDQMLWVVNAFSLTLAALLLVSGLISDRFGRKKIFLLGIILFALASLLCAWAESPFQLSLARALQGMGGALMIPGSLSIINLTIPKERRGRAIGFWAGISGGIAAAGPFFGGILVEKFSWQSIFYVNIPLSIGAIALALYAIPESKSTIHKKLDFVGAATLIAGLSSLTHGLMSVPTNGLESTTVLSFCIIGLALLAFFGYHQLHTKHPLLEISLFRNKEVLGANLATLFIYFALNGLILFSVLNIQQIQGINPSRAGLALMPAILVITALSGFGGSLTDKFGSRKPMVLGSILVAIGSAIFLFAGIHANYFTTFLPGFIIFGLGMAVIIAPLTKSALSVPENYTGAASGLNNAVSRVAALLAIAFLGALAAGIFKTDLADRIQHGSLSAEQKQIIIRQAPKLAGIQIPENFEPDVKNYTQDGIKKSFVLTFRILMLINILLALASAFVSWHFIKDPIKTQTEENLQKNVYNIFNKTNGLAGRLLSRIQKWSINFKKLN